MSENEVQALISLLDDPDHQIYDEIKHKLISFGNEVIPLLEDAWENSFDHLLQDRIEDIIHYLQFDTVKKGLIYWKNHQRNDLMEGAIIVAKYQYPDLDEQALKDEINQLKQDVWLELNDNLTALEQVNVLNRIIFDIHGYYGNKKNINSPKNSYINNVVESKKGNPITLAIIYLSVSQQLNLPIYGVNVPAHFILAYAEEKEDVLFYINLFSRGTVFSKEEIDTFLTQLKLEPKEEYYLPCDNLTIIKRLTQHLVYTYDNLGYLDKKEELLEMLHILD